MLVAVLFAALLCLGVARVGSAAGSRASAQAAADAAALAGAAAGRARRPRAGRGQPRVVVAFGDDGADVVVTVERRGVTATARARWVPAPIP